MRVLTLLPILSDALPPSPPPELARRLVSRVLRPLIELFQDNPTVRMALHPSGALCEHLSGEEPELFAALVALGQRGQVELLAGTWSGAPVSILPEREAVAQLSRHVTWLRERTALPIRGAWFTHGAWCSAIPLVVARAGLSYTFADSGLIRAGGLPLDALNGWLVTEQAGAAVGVFPLDRRVREMMPWATTHSLAQDLNHRARSGTVTLTVDLSLHDLGLDDQSWRWCWAGDKPWTYGFFRLFQRQGAWLKSAVPCQAFDRLPAGPRVYPVSGTPPRVGALALPVEEARHLLDAARVALDEPLTSPVNGPPWEAFLSASDDANRLHKAALRAASGLAAPRREAQRRADRASLERVDDVLLQLTGAQGAACLHDAAGGYLRDGEQRHKSWKLILAALELAWELRGSEASIEQVDYDCDGQPELLGATAAGALVIRPAQGGTVAEWCPWGVGNLVNTLRRRAAVWYGELPELEDLPVLVPDELVEDEPTDSGEKPRRLQANEDPDSVLSGSFTRTDGRIREPLPVRPPLEVVEEGAGDHLWTDRQSRALFVERFLGPETTLQNLSRGQHPEIGDFADGRYRVDRAERADDGELRVSLSREGTVRQGNRDGLLQIVKNFRIHKGDPLIHVSYELVNRSMDPIRARFGVELNLNLDSLLSAERGLIIPRFPLMPLDRAGCWEGVSDAALAMPDIGVQVRMRFSGEPTLFHYPIFVPHRSEVGFVSAFQGSCLMPVWSLELWGEERRKIDIALRVVLR